jgi:ABC-type proline/glycine betaine transport system permease subunit
MLISINLLSYWSMTMKRFLTSLLIAASLTSVTGISYADCPTCGNRVPPAIDIIDQ